MIIQVDRQVAVNYPAKLSILKPSVYPNALEMRDWTSCGLFNFYL